MGREAEVAALGARLVKAAYELVQRRAGYQRMTAEFGVAPIPQHVRIHETIVLRSSCRGAKSADAPEVGRRATVPRPPRRMEREKRSEQIQSRGADRSKTALRQRVVRRHEDRNGDVQQLLEIRAAMLHTTLGIRCRLKLVPTGIVLVRVTMQRDGGATAANCVLQEADERRILFQRKRRARMPMCLWNA